MATSLRATATVVLLLIIVLLGCGSGESPPATAVAAAPGAPKPPAPPPPPNSAEQNNTAGNQLSATPVPTPGGIPQWAGQRPDEPFDVKQFLTSREAPAENAADLYKAAFEQFDRTIPGHEPTTISREAGKFADLEKLASGAYPADQIATLLKSAQFAIEQVDAAQAKPNCVFVTGLGVDALLPHAQTARSVARLSNLQLYQASSTGDFDLVEAAIRRSLRVSRDIQPRGHSVCQLVSMAIDGVVFGGIERVTLRDPRLTTQQCDRILTLLNEHREKGLDRVAEGLHMEYVAQRCALDDLQSGRLTIANLLDLVGAKSDTTANLAQLAPNYEAEIAACNRIFSIAIQESKSPNATATGSTRNLIAKIAADAKSAKASQPTSGQVQVPVLVLFLASPIDPVRDADRRARANLAGLQMLVALKRYELTHGHLPANLDAAAAETALKATPTDPYAQAPLKYAVVSGKPTIYSIGKDLKDDGGTIDWKFSTQPGDFLFVLSPRPETKLTPPPAAAAPAAKSTPPAARPESAIREWTSTVGTKIEAELVRVENGLAILKKRDGTELRVPLDKLSETDQQWIRSARP